VQVATLVGNIAQQGTVTTGKLEKLVVNSNRVTSEERQLRAQVLSLNQSQRAEETKTIHIMVQLHQLALKLNQVQQYLQQHKLKMPNNAVMPDPSSNLMMPQGVHIEDAVLKVHITACIGDYMFESYEDTLKWVTTNCSAEDWQYVMYMPALYSLVHPDGQHYDVLLQEQSHYSRAGYASFTQARLALYIKKKVPGIFGADRTAKNGHPFTAIDTYDKWFSMGIRQGFRYQVEQSVNALESSLSKQMMFHLAHKETDHHMFLTLLTESVQQLLKLHRMMDCQFCGTAQFWEQGARRKLDIELPIFRSCVRWDLACSADWIRCV
jgi:hypothetical protein